MAGKPPRLKKNEREALRLFVSYLHNKLTKEVIRVALFGSKARGDSEPDSDVDVLVITKDDNRLLRREIQRQAARISLEYDLILSPRVIGAARWEQLRGFSLYLNIVRDSAGLNIKGQELVLELAGNAQVN